MSHFTLILAGSGRLPTASEMYRLICDYDEELHSYDSDVCQNYRTFRERISASGDPQACQLFGLKCYEYGRSDGYHPL